MKALLALAIAYSAQAWASQNTYKLDMKLSVDGKHTASPKMIVKEGETATITQQSKNQKTFIEVIAKEGKIKDQNGIIMNMIIGTMNKDGSRKTLSKPMVFVKDGEKAEFSMNDDASHGVSLSILAKRQNL
jgi:hypothetical protein